jgi:hypothetical protein
MLALIKLKMMLTQETTKFQILDLIMILLILFLTSISNKEFTEDGIFQDSQNQNQKLPHLRLHLKLSKKKTKNLKKKLLPHLLVKKILMTPLINKLSMQVILTKL